jgi:hypothetical protein
MVKSPVSGPGSSPQCMRGSVLKLSTDRTLVRAWSVFWHVHRARSVFWHVARANTTVEVSPETFLLLLQAK